MKLGGVFGALFKNLKIFQKRMSRSRLNSDHLSPAHSLTINKFACEDASSHIILYFDKVISLPTLESMFFTSLTTSLGN
jgi:hypothetical protein